MAQGDVEDGDDEDVVDGDVEDGDEDEHCSSTSMCGTNTVVSGDRFSSGDEKCSRNSESGDTTQRTCIQTCEHKR